MSIFITFEGIEGCGKTTQLSLLSETLRRQGNDVLATREPGGCPIADAIRRILLDPAHKGMVSRAELLLYAAARAQHVEEVILPALAADRIVLCDRFTDATLAYQGYGRGLEPGMIEELNALATAGLSPDLTLLLDMPAGVGLKRALQRNNHRNLAAESRFELEAEVFHDKVRQGYLELARIHPERIRIVDARGDVAEVAARVRAAVESFVASRGRS